MRSAFAALSPPRATLVLGAIAGTGTSFVGWGAAQVLIPGLAGATIGATPLQAAALNLCALAAITATSAAVLQKGASAVDPWTALSIGVPAAVCAPLGALAARRVAGRSLQLAFHSVTVVVLPLQGLAFVRRWRGDQQEQQQQQQQQSGDDGAAAAAAPIRGAKPRGVEHLWSFSAAPDWTSPAFLRHEAFGVACGFFSGFLGVAGLPYVVSYLTYSTAMEHATVVGTTMAAVTPAVFVGAATHAIAGSVPFTLAVPLMVASAAGCVVGGNIALQTPETALQIIFVATLALAGLRSARTLTLLLRHGT